MENSNEKKYDISKSNFFANIPEKNDNEIKNEINEQPPQTIQTPLSNMNPQFSQNAISFNNQINNNSNINTINNISNNNISYANSNFFPPQDISSSNFYPPYQINNQYPNNQMQSLNYQNNINYSTPIQNQSSTPTPSPSFFQKVSESAMNLIKKEDPLNLITDINPKFYEEIIEKSKKEIQCQTLQKNDMSDIEIKSIISNPRKVSDSLLKNSYLIYDITTPKLNWFVNRRYSDFVWLREILISLFPTVLIPQLPKKKIGNRRFEEDFVEKRLKGLQNFLDEVLKNEILKTAEPLKTFLSLTERGFFEQQMKVLTPKNILIDSILGIKSFSGKIQVADLETEQLNNSKTYFASVENFFNTQEEELKNIKYNLNEYNLHMVEVCKHLEQMENGFGRLSQYYSKANLEKDICNVLEQYQIFFKNWKRVQINQTSIIRNKLLEYFKYIKNKGLSLIELLKKQNEIQNEYNKIKDDLINKKESYWKKMDITKWEMNPMAQIDSALLFRDKNYAFSKMCFQETLIVNNKGDLLGYYYRNNVLNIKDVINNITKFSLDNLKGFSKEIEPTVTDVLNVWSNLESSNL
jgi:sorting nexin-7/30/sorting nexin-8